ncbi:MAG: hypothetical protein QOH13_939, partial [Thermoleophilaceae bacterium]|nr:hypothetical protein [Thermoleophilaceae bacterium]
MTLAPQQRLAAALALALSLAVASPAAASTASVQGDTVVFAADPGETNAVNVGVDSAGIYIRDTGAVLAAGAGCTIDSHREVTCARGGVARLNVTLGDGDDRLLGSAASGQDLFVTADGGAGGDQLKAENAGSTLDGGAGADTLTGGNGADHLIGGAGQDTLQGGDGADVLDAADADLSDLVDCGAGDDSARVDPAPSGVQAEDATACETV